MCLSCGCNLPNDDHGDKANLTFADLQAAAKAQGISPNDAMKNMNKAVVSDRVKREDAYDTVLGKKSAK